MTSSSSCVLGVVMIAFVLLIGCDETYQASDFHRSR